MGSFKSASARAADQATLTAADRPMARYEDKVVDGVKQPVLVAAEVPEDQWLQPGESITYWLRLPHGAAADIADAATQAVVEPGSRRRAAQMKAVYHPGKAALATFVLGLVALDLRDEDDKRVVIELPTVGEPGWESKAKAIMSGLPAAVVNELQERIGAGSPPSLDSQPDDANGEGDTVGNASGAN